MGERLALLALTPPASLTSFSPISLTGPLIIHSPNDPLVRGTDYDLDQIVFVRDHFHSMSTDIVDDLLTTAGFDGTFIAPSPKSGLINGAGVFNCSLAPEGSTCNTKAPIELVFPPNKKIRLRFVNAGSHAQFKVSVDNHTLEVIEADDTPVYGPTVHRIPINVAQRYSAILDTTGDKQGDAYYLRAQINTDCFGAPFADLDPDVKAIIRISKTNKTPSTNTPTSVDWTDALGGVCTDLDESTLVPRIAVDAPALPDVSYVWNAAFNFTQAGIFIWTLNGVTLENFMYNPLYFQVYKGETINSTLVNNLVVDGIQTVDLVINNLLAADHPFHLHGSKFWIVARGTGQLLESDLPNVTYNTTNPMRRDVLAVPVGQWAIIRIISDIPGVHAFHCHIAWHQAAGLFGVFVIQPDQIQQADIPDSSFALCDASNFEGNLGLLTIDPGRRRRALDAYPHNRRRSVTANATPIKKRWESSFVKKAVINHHPRKH
ncbi:Cupredoxin [Meredithblackwellia eburnea MCA 4105]